MNCRSAEALYSSFLEDELSQKERRSFESHLLGCRRCSLAVRELRATIEMMEQLPDVETSPHFEEDVLARIRSGEAMRPSVGEWVRGLLAPARLRPVFLAGAGACAVWIGVMLAPALTHNGVVATNPARPSVAGTTSSPAATPAPEIAATPSVHRSASGDATLASTSTTAPPAAAAPSSRSHPVRGQAWAANQVPAGTQDSATSSRYADEYIMDQFYINRAVDGQGTGQGESPTITPVSDHPSDDVEIQF